MPFKAAKITQKPSLFNLFKNIFLFLWISLSFFSCNNELDVTAPYKEKILVYGLIDPAQPKQYIKVNKMFLDGKIDPTIMAQNPDTIYPKNIKVRLKHFDKAGKYKNEELLNKIILQNRNKGVFADSPNYVFTTINPVIPGDRYDISIERDNEGVLCSSSTNCVGIPRILFPVPNNTIAFFLKDKTKLQIRLIKGKNVTAMEAYMSFTYEEYDKNTTLKTTKTIRWNFIPYTTSIGEESSPSFIRILPSDLFFEFIADNVKKNLGVSRVAKSVSFEYYSCDKQLSDYISVSKPSIGVVQKSSGYTNIKNGLGVFGSRQYTAINGAPLSPETLDALRKNKFTKDLGF